MEEYTTDQHFYPKCLLKHFADNDEKVFQYILASGKINHVRYDTICYHKNTYEGDVHDNVLEKTFRKYENKLAPIIQSIIDSYNKCEPVKSMPIDEIAFLWKYMSLQSIRTDAGRIIILEHIIFPLMRRTGPVSIKEIKDKKDLIRHFNNLFKTEKSLNKLLSYYGTPAQHSMVFHVAYTDLEMLTSDNPVVAMMRKDKLITHIFLPIHPHICLEFQLKSINNAKTLMVFMEDKLAQFIRDYEINSANYSIISKSNLNDADLGTIFKIRRRKETNQE